MDFAAWMKSAGLSDSSISKYVGAIEGRLTDWAKKHKLSSKVILDVSDVSAFVSLANAIRQTPEFREWNVIGHHMYGAALKNYEKFLTSLQTEEGANSQKYGPYSKHLAVIEEGFGKPFDPKGQEDARARILRDVVQRRGQRKFRQSLITAYSGCCAMTGCPVTPLLEAAHITPYLGPDTNSVTNGLLLRADLHTLWDLGLIAVNPDTQTVWISPEVNDATYQALSGRPLVEPAYPSQKPSIAALQQQWNLVHSTNTEVTLEA